MNEESGFNEEVSKFMEALEAYIDARIAEKNAVADESGMHSSFSDRLALEKAVYRLIDI